MDKFKQVAWHSPEGEVVACHEKNKVMQENLAELVANLASPYPGQK